MNGTPSIAGVPYKTNNLNKDKKACKEQAQKVNNSPKITLPYPHSIGP
jgi:cbb3-type cytochrome oxidase cytochrome c subunit